MHAYDERYDTPLMPIHVTAVVGAGNVYIITDKMGGDGALACSAVVVTHLMSLFTMTAIIFAMRTARLI